jgi:hypothetical protein
LLDALPDTQGLRKTLGWILRSLGWLPHPTPQEASQSLPVAASAIPLGHCGHLNRMRYGKVKLARAHHPFSSPLPTRTPSRLLITRRPRDTIDDGLRLRLGWMPRRAAGR